VARPAPAAERRADTSRPMANSPAACWRSISPMPRLESGPMRGFIRQPGADPTHAGKIGAEHRRSCRLSPSAPRQRQSFVGQL